VRDRGDRIVARAARGDHIVIRRIITILLNNPVY
jgi:hypothetical protein